MSEPTTARELATSEDAPRSADEVLLTGQRVRVCLLDGSDYVVKTIQADRVRYDLTRGKHKWPPGTEAPFLWFTFLAWAAARREGHTALTFEAFSDVAVSCTALDNDPDEDDVVPTNPGQQPG